MGRADLECISIAALVLGLLIGLFFINFAQAVRAELSKKPSEPPEPWGSGDYPPEKYIPLGELYKRYPPEDKEK